MKSTTKKSFQMSGPLRSVRVAGGAGGVRVALNGREVVSVRNVAPSPSGEPTPNAGATPAADDLSTIKLGRFIVEQAEQQTTERRQPAADDEDERDIVVGPITPIPPLPTPGGPSPLPRPKPARLGL